MLAAFATFDGRAMVAGRQTEGRVRVRVRVRRGDHA
jgi:hypothetical protein